MTRERKNKSSSPKSKLLKEQGISSATIPVQQEINKHLPSTKKSFNHEVLYWKEKVKELTAINLQLHEDLGKQTETIKKLKYSEDRFSKAVEVSLDGFWDWDGAINRVYRSQGWFDMLGYSHNQFDETIATWQSLIHPDDLNQVNNQLNAHLNGETELYECEYRMKTNEGSYKWILDRGKVFERDKDGKLLRMIGVHKDVTTEKRARDTMLESWQKYQTLVENSSDMVFRFNLSGNILYMNPFAIHFFDKADNIDSSPFPLPQDLHGDLDKLLQDAVRSGKPVRKTIEFNHSNESYTFDWQITPEFNIESQVESLIASGRDISQLKQVEKELRNYRLQLERLVDERTFELTREIEERKKIEKLLIHAKHKAEASDQLKSAFLANLSHEIRTPMNAILGFSALLGNPQIGSERKNNFIRYINTNAQGLMDQINDILDLSKLEAEVLLLQKESFNPIDFFNSEKKVLETQLLELKPRKQLQILTEIPDHIPYSSIWTDRYRLSQVFSKLLSNAVKFTEKGFIQLGFQLQPKGRILFFVKDTGIGIHKNDLSSIFHPFSKVAQTSGKLYRGMGMGLSIAQKLVQLLGGELLVDSVPGQGSRFYFEIPCYQNNSDPINNPKTPVQ